MLSAEKELEESFGTNKNKQVMTATMLIQMRTTTLLTENQLNGNIDADI